MEGKEFCINPPYINVYLTCSVLSEFLYTWPFFFFNLNFSQVESKLQFHYYWFFCFVSILISMFPNPTRPISKDPGLYNLPLQNVSGDVPGKVETTPWKERQRVWFFSTRG